MFELYSLINISAGGIYHIIAGAYPSLQRLMLRPLQLSVVVASAVCMGRKAGCHLQLLDGTLEALPESG